MKDTLRHLKKNRKTKAFVESLKLDQLSELLNDWPLWARSKQKPPLENWRTWLLLGGRGAGKTRTGAEWLKGVALSDPHQPGNAGGRVALVGESYAEVRDVMVEGQSGLLQLHKHQDRPVWKSSRRELEWPNGTIGQLFSSSDPEGLRGYQFGAAWCDELCKWNNLDETWDMLQFCLRLGASPRQVVTTTPKPLKLLKKIMQDPSTIINRSATMENKSNLASGFLQYVNSQYGNTRLGRQELNGEVIEEREDALWQRDMFERLRVSNPPELERVVIAVDPPASSGKTSAACGIIAAGKSENGNVFILEDKSLHMATPKQWAKAVVSLYHAVEADVVIAETNQGGEMVETIIRTIEPSIPVRGVHASRGKWLRAEPVALLYERNEVFHVGMFAELEDQMCAFGADGSANGVSPDRLDALVWAVTELALSRRATPRIRS